MKILDQNVNKDGTIKVKLCLCKGQESTCKDKDRPIRTFQTAGKLANFKKSFHIK